METKSLQVSAMGSQAKQVLRRNPDFQVRGITSRGIFLQPPDDLTVYISGEEYRGPLTLNVSGGLPNLISQNSAKLAVVSNQQIQFGSTHWKLSLQGADIWTPSAPSKSPQLQKSISELVERSQRWVGQKPEFKILEPLSVDLNVKELGQHPYHQYYLHLTSLKRALPSGLSEGELPALLGLGPGLTPLGDDFLLGFALALNRTAPDHYPEPILESFNQQLLSAAREKTTRLSFSLLVCAVSGAADERLITILDRLTSTRPIHPEHLRDLLLWGSSSGIAALAGMLLALC